MDKKHEHIILFVDDEQSILNALKRLFRKTGYQILTASSGREGLERLKEVEKPVSLIISDQRMPEMTGAQFLEQAKNIFPDAVRFLLTGYSDMDAIVEAVNKGEIHRYLNKPWNDDDLLLLIQQALQQYELVFENRRLTELTQKQNEELNELNRDLEKKVAERTREISEKNEELAIINHKLEDSFLGTIRLMSSLIETLNPKLGKYMKDVAQLSKEVANEFKVDQQEVDIIEIAGMIHDIGLLGLPETTWAKDEKEMSPREFKMFSQHPLIAQMCLEAVDRLNDVSHIILHHHEHFDGCGFPNGLKDTEIPFGSKIIGAVSDYCKIVNTWPLDRRQIVNKSRKYFNGSIKDLVTAAPEKMLVEIAKKILLQRTKKRYDPQVVTILTKIISEPRKAEMSADQSDVQTRWIQLTELKKGMVLATDLRINDGRLLLAKGSILKEASIKSIQSLGANQLIDNEIFIQYGI